MKLSKLTDNSYISTVIEKLAKFFRGVLFGAPGRSINTQNLVVVSHTVCTHGPKNFRDAHS